MKTGLFFSAVFLFLIGLFVASTGQAETVECTSATTFEVFINEDCPPPLACDDGYSCQKDDVIPPAGNCAEWLEEYVNPDQAKLPAHRVYPMGQKMMIAAWLADSGSEMAELKNAGFTMQGPVWNTSDLSYLKTASDYGLRSAHRVYTGSIAKTAALLAESLKDPAKRQAIVNRMKSEIHRVVNDPVYNEVVDVWLTGTEELSARGSALNTSSKPDASAWDSTYNELWYLDQFQKAVNQYDPQKRPLWMSDVTGTSKAQMMRTHKYLGMVGPQAYLGRVGGGGYATDAVMGGLARTARSTGDALGIPATASLDLYYEPIPSRATAEMINKITKQWIYLGLNNGLQGFQLYAWYNYPVMTKETRAKYYAAYLAHVKELTDNGLDYTYLWGDRRSDLTVDIISGPSETYGYPSISMANIQYGNDRYVMLTNSAEKTVKVRVSGFPDGCQSIHEIQEGKIYPLGTSINPTIEPLGVRMYKVSK